MYWSISERKPSQRSIKLCNWSLHSVCSRAHFLWLGQVGDKTSKRLHHSCLHFGRNKLSKHEAECRAAKIRWPVLLRNGSEASPFLSNKGEVLKRNVLLGYHTETGEGFFSSQNDILTWPVHILIYLYTCIGRNLHILIMIFLIIDLVMLDATGMTSS